MGRKSKKNKEPEVENQESMDKTQEEMVPEEQEQPVENDQTAEPALNSEEKSGEQTDNTQATAESDLNTDDQDQEQEEDYEEEPTEDNADTDEEYAHLYSPDREPSGKKVFIRVWRHCPGTKRINDPDLKYLTPNKHPYFPIGEKGATREGVILPFAVPDDYAKEISPKQAREGVKVLLVPRLLAHIANAGMTAKIEGVN